MLALEQLLGSSFLYKNFTVGADCLYTSDRFVGVLFSCKWAPPCQDFAPILKEFYDEINKDRKQLEIVYVSSDETFQEFWEFFSSQMSWLAIPFGDERIMDLKGVFSITAVPVLVILRKDGTVVTTNARNDIYMLDTDAINHWS